MTNKLRVAVLFGGKSGEHDVSLLSAASVIQAIDLNKYEIIPIGLSKEGKWQQWDRAIQMLEGKLSDQMQEQLLKQVLQPQALDHSESILTIFSQKVDVVFPVLHGTFGEDGTMQGFFEVVDIPYVGAGVLSSAVGMDKIIAKKLFAAAGIPQAQYVAVLHKAYEQNKTEVIDEIERKLGYPCFVKPANLGSSVGISKANNQKELDQSLQLAGRYDRKIVVEQYIAAREVEVAVLGNDFPEVSVPGEIISSNDFYDFRAKYVDGKSMMQIPADLSVETTKQIQQMAVQAFQAIDGSGLSRVDFFVEKETGKVLLNEVNTMPGFTAFSMYTKLWEHVGLNYSELIHQLIQLAIVRYQEKNSLTTTYEVE